MKVIELICKLRTGGFELEDACDIITWMAERYKYNYVDAVVKAEEIWQEQEGAGTVTRRIKDYIETTQGYFSVTDCDKEARVSSTQDKGNRRVILHRLVKEGLLERHPTKNGLFRRIEHESPVIEWETADIANTFKMLWPFELENYALMYPKNIAVISGSPDAGKTAFLLNVTKLNMDKYIIHYFTSEMGAEEMKLRISKFDDVVKWVFDPRERSSNFADVIYPDDINIIDYFEFGKSEFYTIAEELRAIFDKLNKGIAIVALQKKRGAELGRGAEFGLEKPRIYLSMDSGLLKIIKAKNWAVEGQNPNGMEFKFSLVNGAKFIY